MLSLGPAHLLAVRNATKIGVREIERQVGLMEGMNGAKQGVPALSTVLSTGRSVYGGVWVGPGSREVVKTGPVQRGLPCSPLGSDRGRFGLSELRSIGKLT